MPYRCFFTDKGATFAAANEKCNIHDEGLQV